MAIPHPFKTVRRAGTPSTGGSVMTLQSHVASPTAHPIYQKKGDAVGNVSLAEHNNDVGAHRMHYLRRLELATSLAEYDASKVVDPAYYAGSNPTDISNIYKSIPTTYLLELIFSNPDTYFPKVLTKAAVIDDTAHDASDAIEAPSWRLFKEMYLLVNSFTSTGSSNPLAELFAAKDHRHDGIYSLTGHQHRITDIVDVYGNVSVAAVDHDHDDRYWLRSEVLDTVFDPSVLRTTGIWPNMPYVKVVDTDVAKTQGPEEQKNLDLDLYGVQGNYSFHIDAVKASLETYHYPEAVAKSMEKRYTSSSDKASDIFTNEALEQTAILSVLANNSEPFDFSKIRAVDYLNTDPSKSHTYRVVNQMLSVNAPIKKYDRIALGTSIAKAVEQYKDAVAGIFWRTGYSLETAWYIDGLLQIANLDVVSLMSLVSSGDPVTAIAEHVESALDRRMSRADNNDSDNSASDPLSYITVGYYHPDVGIASEEVVRATKFTAAIGGAYSGILAKTVETSDVKIVHHDSTDWTIPNKVSRGSQLTAAAASSLFDEMKVFFLYSKLLPYRNYYTTTSSENILSYPANDSIAFSGTRLSDEYTYRKNSVSHPYSRDISRFDLKSNDANVDSLVDASDSVIAYPDEELISGEMPLPLLAEFRKCRAGTVYLDGVNYYEKDGTHNGTCVTKMKLKAHVVGATITGDVYRKVLVVNTIGYARQMLRPIVFDSANIEYYDASGNTNYYVYNSDTHTFTAFQPIEEYFDPSVSGAVQVYTPYSIYKVSYADTKLELEEGDLLPITVNNTQMLAGVTYKYFETAVPYSEDTGSYQFPDGGVTVIPRVPEYAGTTDPDAIDTTEYKYYTLSGSTYTPITGEVVPSDNLYRLPVDTEGTRYVVAGTKIPVVVNNGVAEVHYGVTNLKYSDTVDLGAVRCKAFFFETLDTEFVEYKQYFTAGEGRNFILVADRTGSPRDKGLYERIDVEDYFNVAAAVIQLTTVGANATVNGKRLVYTIDSSNGLITWDDWQRLITERNIDATMTALGVVYDDDPLWVALVTANTNYSIANTFAKAKLLASTTADNISALNRLKVAASQNTGESFKRLYDTVKDDKLAYLGDFSNYVKKLDGTETTINGNIDMSYSECLDRLDQLEQALGDHLNDHTKTGGLNARLSTLETTVGGSTSGLVKETAVLRSELGDSTNKIEGKTIYSRLQAIEDAAGLSVSVIDTEIDLSSAAAGDDVKVLTLGSGEYENFMYSVVLRDNTRNIMIPCPTAEIADPRHTGYVPVYVSASSLIFVKSDGVYLHVPNSWLDIYGGGNDLSVYIRRIPVRQS